MRKVIVLLICVLIPLWALTYVIAGKGEADLDPVLEAALKEQLQTNNLSKKAILSVESLDLSNYNLTSAKGLEQFTNLKELNLSNNLLEDSSFLIHLENLENLNLSYNHFKELELNSEKINKLNLRGNLINSIEFVENLPDITYLNLRDNEIEDITPVSNNTQLTYFNIRGNKVKSLEPLTSLVNLEDLNIRDNQIHSIQPIVNLPLTKRLSLDGNEIEDLALLEDKLITIADIDFEIGLPAPKLSKESGFYGEDFTLEIEAEEDYEIYYTLDGSTPNVQANKYEGPIEISKEVMYNLPSLSDEQFQSWSFEPQVVKSGIVVKAVAGHKKTKAGAREFSDPVSATFILDERLKEENNLPVISLTVNPKDLFDYDRGIYVPGVWYEPDSPWSGNYSQKGREFEREAVFELYNKDKELELHQNVGIRINGGASRRFAQKSLRIYARDDYGQSTFFTNIFEDLDYDRFNLLLLRNSGQDYLSTLLRDGLMQELVKDLEVDVQAYQPAVVLINGDYWGIHNIREKYNEHYVMNKYNIDKNDLILMKVFTENNEVDFDVKSGGNSAKSSYFHLLDFVENNDMTKDENYRYVEEKIDMDNFLHYVAYQVFYANTDSFSNNLMIWKKNTEFVPNAPKGHDGRWRWMLYDLDWGMGYFMKESDHTGDPVDYNMIKHVLKDEPRMTLFRNLMNNEDAQKRFVQIMLSLLNDNFETNHVQAKINELAENIRPEIGHSIERWGNIESVENWEENIQVLRDFAEKRPQIVKEHMMQEFNLTEEDMKKLENEIN